MSISNKLDPSPFVLENGPVGVLLIHGFTGSPTEMRLVGADLHRRGLTIAAPLLPGHGTTVSDLSQQHWQDWVEHVNAALTELESHCPTVFVAGISLGSLLALHLAAEHVELRGIILYSPLVKMPGGIALYLVPLLKYFMQELPKGSDFVTDPSALTRLWSYPTVSLNAVHEMARLRQRVQAVLPGITCPTLIVHSTLDRLIARNSAQYTHDHLGGSEKTLIALHNSGHNVTLDSEWEAVSTYTYDFIQRRLAAEEVLEGDRL
jgi:carboxylesterase